MIWVFLPLLLFCASCGLPFKHLFVKPNSAADFETFTQVVDSLPFSEIIIPYATELRYTKRLRFEDSKLYYDENFARRFRVIFSSEAILELCEARDLMVTVVEGLLERMNASGGVTSAFDHFPIEADDLELYFSFESFDIEYNDGTYIAWMSLHDGLVRYITGWIKNPRIDFWDARIEPYYKSLQFVQITRAAEEAVPAMLKLPKKTSRESHFLDL